MELTNSTEERYREAAKALEDINVTRPFGVLLLSNIVGICEAVARGEDSKTIVNTYDLGCKPNSFATLFKNVTGCR